MSRAIGFATGFLAFMVAHTIEVLRWTAWFGGTHQPWFLNAGRSIVFTMACVLAASIPVALLDPSPRPARGLTIGTGAFAAMTLVLFLQKEGPGTIFPIVMVFGGIALLISSTAGAWLGRELRRALRRA